MFVQIIPPSPVEIILSLQKLQTEISEKFPTNLLFTYITSLVCGMSFNLPESNQTIEKDLQEIGPSILYAPSFVYKHIITSINAILFVSNKILVISLSVYFKRLKSI